MMKMMLIALLLFGLGEGSNVNITFMYIVSSGEHGFDSSGAIPAIDMALEDINGNDNILPGYNLVYDKVRDSEVSICEWIWENRPTWSKILN